MQAQTLQALETKATTLEEEMRTLGRQNEAYQTSLKQMQESKAETERQLAEALELQAGLYTREVALQVQVMGLQKLLKADAEIQKDLKDRCREQADKTERLEGEMATQAKAVDLLRADYDKLQVEVSRLRVEKEALEKQDILEVTHEGTTDVKRARKHALIQEYEMFRMLKVETIADVHKRFSHIPKVTVISESKDLTTLTTTSLFGKLREHELETNMMNDQEHEEKHVKSIALKVAGNKDGQELSEFLTCLPENSGHIKTDFPNNESKERGASKKFEKKGKAKRAYIAWQDNDVSSSRSSSNGDEEANLCLMAKGENKKQAV
ncbi:uncharacterized protein [Phaseolus vulgaris]|uniref:uncharacterized protein n=1 Tax=Phaseolus vulgaris TaxID=3885 RepID=UPI0035CAC202